MPTQYLEPTDLYYLALVPVLVLIFIVLCRKLIDRHLHKKKMKRIRLAIQTGRRRTVGELFDSRPPSHHIN